MTDDRRTRHRRGESPLRAAGRPLIVRGGNVVTPPPRVTLDPGLLRGDSDDEILRCYIELVQQWRGTEHDDAPRLRRADVAVLVSILGTDRIEIERRLIAVTACTSAAARRGRRLLLAGLGGALTISLTAAAVASTVGVTRVEAATAARQQPSPVVRDAPPAAGPLVDHNPSTTDVEPRAADAHPQARAATAARHEPTTSDEASPASVPTVASPRDAEATVSIPSLGVELPVVEGGQSVIDEGVVAHYVAAGWKDPVAPGAAGTYWLAAHHVTHGGPFAALPQISVGAEIRITTDTSTFIYTVTSVQVVGLSPGDVPIYGVDDSSPVILLQTCVDNTHRFLVHGTLTTRS